MVFPVAGSWVYPWKVVAGIHRGATTISWPQWVQAAGADRVLHLLYPPSASYNHPPTINSIILLSSSSYHHHPTIILLQSSSLSSAGSGTLNTYAVLLWISVVRRQILDPDCIFVQSDVMHHRISPPLWCRVAASVLICGAQWWRHNLPVFHPGSGGGGDTHAVVTHIIISTADVSPVSV